MDSPTHAARLAAARLRHKAERDKMMADEKRESAELRESHDRQVAADKAKHRDLRSSEREREFRFHDQAKLKREQHERFDALKARQA
jgi:hypothetical protein